MQVYGFFIFLIMSYPFDHGGINIFYLSNPEYVPGKPCDDLRSGGIHTSHIAIMSLEVHTMFYIQIGGKSRIACDRVVSPVQSSVVRYENFAR